MTTSVESPVGDNAQVVVDSSDIVSPRIESIKRSVDKQFEGYLDHPILIRHVLWNGATVSSTVTSDLLTFIIGSAPAAYKRKLSNLYYFDCDIKIKIVVQGTAQAFGQLVYVFMPHANIPSSNGESTQITVLNRATPVNAKVVPHIIVDPSKTATYEIVLPNVNPVGLYTMDPTRTYGSYLFQERLFNPIGSGTSVAATANICVYASLVNVRAEGLTAVTMTAPDFNEEKKGGTLSGVATAATALSDSIGRAFPALSPFTKAFSTVSEPISKVLSWFGFSKPPEISPTIVLLNRTCDTYSQVDGKYSATVLASSQTSGVAISPGYGGGSLDDMDVMKICSKPGLIILDQVVDSSAAAGADIMQIAVTPAACMSQVANSFNPTPLAVMAVAHNYWKGDLIYTFEIVASVFHRATLLISYDPYPSGVAATLAEALMTRENVTVNVSGNTTVRVRVPYRQVKPMCQVGPFMTPGGPFAGEINGFLNVYVINPVKSNGSADGIRVNVYVSSDNIALSGPTPAKIGLYMAMSDEFIAEATEVSFGRTDLDDVGVAYVPDRSHSVKQIAARMTPWLYKYLPAAANTNSFLSVGNIPQWRDTVGEYFTLVGWVSLGYLGVRGSINYSYEPVLTTTNTISVRNHTASHHIHMLMNRVDAGVNPLVDYEDAFAWTQPNLNVCSRVDVNCPIMVPWRYLPMAINFERVTDNVVFENELNIAAQMSHSLSMGAGDNMSFCTFIGFPVMYIAI